MGISPIETVTLLPKSQEASVLKSNETQRPIHNQISLQQHINQQAARDSRQAVKTQDAENNKYRYDAKEKGNNKHEGSSQKKNSSKKDSNEKKNPINYDGTSFDIRI